MATLHLSGLNLQGELPEVDGEDGWLASIAEIDLSNNPGVTGRLVPNWGCLTSLSRLNLSRTNVQGELPDQWGGLGYSRRCVGLVQLQTLSLRDTAVAGRIPLSWLTGMPHLVTLDLAGTALQDVLSTFTSVRQMPALKVLDVSSPTSPSCGPLPDGVAIWAGMHLETLSFSGHNYCGCAPDSWRRSRVLARAARQSNVRLLSPLCSSEAGQRCIPGSNTCATSTLDYSATAAFLRAMVVAFPEQLRHLWIGDDICRWERVSCPTGRRGGVTVDLTDAGLSGALPTDAWSLSRTGVVYVDTLLLGGNTGLICGFPTQLDAAVPLLRVLDLSGTNIMGPIPSWEEFELLEEVYISRTLACAGLPPWHRESRPLLRIVNFSNSRLHGPLAESWNSFLDDNSSLVVADLRGNGFCGCIPSSSWLSYPAILLETEMFSLLSSQSCEYSNACGNLNQQYRLGGPLPSAPQSTLATLRAVRDAFAGQLGDSWIGEDYCSGRWVGVVCEADSRAPGMSLVSLQLAGMQLAGELPNLPAGVMGSRVLIVSIDMSDNTGIGGMLPVSWGDFTALRSLDLSRTGVFGAIPDSWQGMRSLESIAISRTSVCQGLPNWQASRMPSLRTVNFASNLMIGGLSSAFGSFGDQLTSLDLSSNSFCGCVPDSWTAPVLLKAVEDCCPGMLESGRCASDSYCRSQHMRCYEGQQEPLAPDPSVGFLRMLRASFLRSTPATSGSKAIHMLSTWRVWEAFPNFCNGWAGIQCSEGNYNGFSVDLSHTGLGGPLPHLGDLDTTTVPIRSLNFSGNAGVVGPLPSSWANLNSLVSLDLSGTRVSSALPASWGKMANLRTVSLAGTGVCGTLPSWGPGGLISLESVDLSQTNLSGQLADSWGEFSLSHLTNLNLSGNNDLCECLPATWRSGFTLVAAVADAFGASGIVGTCDECPPPVAGCPAPDGAEDREDSSDSGVADWGASAPFPFPLVSSSRRSLLVGVVISFLPMLL